MPQESKKPQTPPFRPQPQKPQGPELSAEAPPWDPTRETGAECLPPEEDAPTNAQFTETVIGVITEVEKPAPTNPTPPTARPRAPAPRPAQSSLPAMRQPAPPTGNLARYVAFRNAHEQAEIVRANFGPGGLTPTMLSTIKWPTGGALSWEIPTTDGVKAVTTIRAMILYWHDGRAYYTDRNIQAGRAPDCASLNGINGRGTPGGPCDQCEMSQWGSAIADDGTEAPGQACRQQRLLLILRPEDRLPLLMRVPPTSTKKAIKFFALLVNEGLKYRDVEVELSLEKGASRAGKPVSLLVGRKVAVLTADEKARVTEVAAAIESAFSAGKAALPDRGAIDE